MWERKKYKYDALSVASYIVKYWRQKTQEDITILALLKYCFFCYGWYLAKNQERLFKATIKTFPLGPVITEIYSKFSEPEYRNNYHVTKRFEQDDFSFLAFEDVKFIESIVDLYSSKLPMELSDITHLANAPWSKVVSEKGMFQIISDKLVADYYEALMNDDRIF